MAVACLCGNNPQALWANGECIVREMIAVSGLSVEQIARLLRKYVTRKRGTHSTATPADATLAFYEREFYVMAQHLVLALQPSGIFRQRFLLEAAAQLDREHVLIADLGCGPGAIVTEILKRHPSWRAEAMDISNFAVNYARRLATVKGVAARLTIRTGDIQTLPYPDDQFDLVVCSEVLEHVDEPQRALEEINRVLKPDGHAVITMPLESRSPLHIHSPANGRHAGALMARVLEVTDCRTKRLVGFGDDFAHVLIKARKTPVASGSRLPSVALVGGADV